MSRSIQEVAASENDRLKDDPNIVAVGYGIKVRGGRIEYRPCLQYFVRTKLPAAEVAALASWLVPAEVEGHPTDVVAWAAQRTQKDNGPPTGRRNTSKEDPLVGGTSTTVISGFHSFPDGYGTLGGLCVDGASGAALAISNAHVWGPDTGEDVIQPWLPISDYFEALFKLVLCGPLAYPLEWTAPSALTATLGAAATAAWVAAIASDEEDPSRLGQRLTPVPADRLTSAEEIAIDAELPDFPVAGRAYSAPTTWRYTRRTNLGDEHNTLTQPRPNLHVLTGKRVWSDKTSYRRGQVIELCAEVIGSLPCGGGEPEIAARSGAGGGQPSQDTSQGREDFLIALIYPLDAPDRMVRRVLRPGPCRFEPPPDRQCFTGFPAPVVPSNQAVFPLRVGEFRFGAATDSVYVPATVPGAPAGALAIQVPAGGLRVVPRSSTRVELTVWHKGAGVTARAFNGAGAELSTATSSAPADTLETLVVTGPEVVLVQLESPGPAFLLGACRSAERFASYPPVRTYVGRFDTDNDESRGRWGIVLSVQTIDETPLPQALADPLRATRCLGGITRSANAVDLGACVVVEILDHAFDIL